MFSNGNGRTSRFMYDLISENLSDENAVFYFHGDGERNDLEQARGIMDIFYMKIFVIICFQKELLLVRKHKIIQILDLISQ